MMPKLILRSSIIMNALVGVVFSCLTDTGTYASVISCVVGVEHLTPDQTRGVGTRIKTTRKYCRFRSSVEMECTNYIENRHVRLVRDDRWDILITVEGCDGGTASTFMVCEVRSYSTLSRMMTLLFAKSIRRELMEYMANFKTYCKAKLQRRQEQIACIRGDDMTTLHGRDKSAGSIGTSATGALSRENSAKGSVARPPSGARMTGLTLFTPAAA